MKRLRKVGWNMHDKLDWLNHPKLSSPILRDIANPKQVGGGGRGLIVRPPGDIYMIPQKTLNYLFRY
jgi:hypothetical protein